LFIAVTPAKAGAQDNPESAYLNLHRATLAHNLSEMMLYASEAKRTEFGGYAGNPVPLRLAASMMPRVYTVRSLATSPDGSRARMRATGTFTFMGTTAPTFGVIDLVREASGWKVDKFDWTGDKPHGFDAAVAQSPVRRGAGGTLEKVAPVPIAAEPVTPAKAGAVAEKLEVIPAPVPAPVAAPVVASPLPGMVQRSANRAPCEIKPVMTDEDLANCGASPR
jgi:hypothetical protein